MPKHVNNSSLDTDSTFASNSDVKVPTQKAVKTALDLKAPLASPTFTGTVTVPSGTALTSPVINTGVSGTAIDTDTTLAANSDTKLASQKATKAYADTKATDSLAVHLAGTETITGAKTFSAQTVVSGDAGTSTVGGLTISGTTDVLYEHITGPTAQPFRITDTRSSSANNGGGMALGANDGAAMASGDRLCYWLGHGYDGTVARNGGSISIYADGAWSSNNFPTKIVLDTALTSSRISRLELKTTEAVFNETGAVTNFRVEGDTDQNLIFGDATNDRVGIGNATPASKLHVDGGDIEVDDIASGVIIKSANGTRWRITVDNDGSLTTASI